MTQDDLLYRFRLRVFAMAYELGNVRAACRAMGIHPPPPTGGSGSWTAMARRSSGPASDGHPAWPMPPVPWWSSGWSPSPLATQASARPGSLPSSPDPSGAASSSPRTGCGGCCAATASALAPSAMGWSLAMLPHRACSHPEPAPERHLHVEHPGQLVQLECVCIGRLSGTKGTVWQYTAIDVASADTWATLQVTRRNPRLSGPASSPSRSRLTWPPAAGSWSE